ncbi:SusC/RagA family TonB-linked outer membrane protein [Niastella populi]|uniref:SusC/RagA family TonB-linked outer membrane protein n=1 Tax=Niastella populi TaxID=550983 RepID=A0A1V9FD05_9BACT|nr:TonB-dependent receptor [Niastella populi]OQP56270.1 SusC/RagA family TonB-linked outer membrane protein [Niastella populi]
MRVTLVVLHFFIPLFLFAQTRTISGTVSDEKGVPLAAVSVMVKGTSTGTQTDVSGNFKLPVTGTGKVILVVSSTGFRLREIATDGNKPVSILLETLSSNLDDVVVIGYQTVSRRNVTGSVSSVAAKDMKDIPLSSAAEAITGRLAGVQVTTTEGRPGADILVRVRGGGSITQDNSPLYIVDGIQMENALSVLSLQEIESINVLKDAASTAIYGARGANGVIIITTKGGHEMKTKVTYNGFAGVRKIVNKLAVMNPYDYVKYQYQIYNYNTNQETRDAFRDRYGSWEDLELYKSMPFTDWQDKVFGRDAFSQTHVLGVTGGTKSTTFNIGLNNTDEEGIMLNSGFKRTLATLKLDHKVNDRFKVGINTRYSRQRIDGVGTSSTGTQGTNRLRNSVRFRPFIAPGLESQVDEFDENYANLTNLTSPLLLANQELKYDYRNDVIVNGYFSYEIIKGLTYKTVLGINNTERKTNTFNGVVTGIARQNADMPVVQMTTGDGLSLTNSNTLNYRRGFGKHQIDVLVGQEIYEARSKSLNITTKWLPKDITPEQAFAGIQKATPPSGLIQDAPSTSHGINRLLSVFSRANYSYDGKYMATFTLRRDGSSLFAKENRNAYFPSMALAWRISDEEFMKEADFISELKMRFSIGTAGNNRIGADLYKTMFTASGNDGYAFNESVTPGFAALQLANANLKWETTVSRNLGLDIALFRNRLNATIDWYFNNTRDLLLQANIPQTSGYTTQFQNIGKTENKGLEIQLNGTVMRNKDFNWNASFNMAFNKNKIVSLGLDPSGQPKNSYLEEAGWISATYQDFLVQVGQPIGQFYGYVTDGFYTVDDFDYNASTQAYTLKADVANTKNVALGNRDPQPGDLKLKKLGDKADMMIGAGDRTVLGNAQPKFSGGFNQQFSYKGFDASIFMNFSVGNKVYNANKIEFTTQYLYRDNNMLASMNDRWKWYDDNGVKVTDPVALSELNANTKYWTPSAGQYFLHSFAIEDGSFLRISNVTLGYSLPDGLLKKSKVFSQFRVYATVNNLLTLTGYSGFDPEANTRRSNPLTPGVDYAAYPRSRYILAGVNVTF